MKLTYWVAECLGDSDAYNIRERTKREATRRRDEHESAFSGGYGPVKKVTIEYADGFDLMKMCLSEGRGYWESRDTSGGYRDGA